MSIEKSSRPQQASGNPDKVSCYICYSYKDGIKYATSLTNQLTDHVNIVNHYSHDISFKHEIDFIDTIRNQLQYADILILIGTYEAFSSHRVLAEIDFFIQSRRIIFPITFLGFKITDIPPALRELRWFVEDQLSPWALPSERILNELWHRIENVNTAQLSNVEKGAPPKRQVETHPLNEGKLIFVGRGEVGKTSLVKRLVDNTFRGDESKTQGINITTWSLKYSSITCRLNIWDFGGQEIMHATHQFFLTERSLYILVLKGREGGEDMDAEYWLKHIESFGGDSPVIVVQNKIIEHPFELNYRGLQARYPQIRGFIKTDCKDEIGLDDLRSMIQQVIGEMPEIHMPFPLDWFLVKYRLESMKDEYMGYERFRDLCYKEGIEDESDQTTLRWVLHCLGIALNYSNDSRLRETSVLKPEWVTHGIYSILNAKELADRQGELQLNDLQQLLPKNRYPIDKHLFLLELMRKFSLCFAFPDEEDRYLIPELLGKEEPQAIIAFPPSDCLNFEYHYGILPEGLIPRFIVRSHILSRDQERWRTGVILAHEECKALIKAEIAEFRIIIRVKGGNASSRRRLLAIIRYDFEGIHSEFKGRLDARAKVPLIGFPEFSIDYNKLIAFEKEGVTSFPEFIRVGVITVQVNELLNGVDLEDSVDGIIESKAIFFSYSHKDEGLRDELETHLKLLQRQGVISTWYDRKILPGSEWDHEIDSHLDRAKIILLLISADFIASDYCWENEVKRAMELHHAGEATVVPILLRSCDWKDTPFGKLQGLPKDMVPIVLFKDRDSAWTEVAKGIRAVAEMSQV